MRKLIVAANWKMNKTPDEAKVFVEEIKTGINKNVNYIAWIQRSRIWENNTGKQEIC